MHVLSESFAIFTFAGIWQPVNWKSPSTKSVLYKIYTTTSIILVYTLTISELIGAYLMTKSLADFTDFMFLLCSTVNVCWKTANIIIYRDRLIRLAGMLLEARCLPRSASEAVILDRFNKNARFLSSSLLHLAQFYLYALR